MELYKRVGQRLREARQAKGLSQEELGRALNYTATAISYYESGTRKIRLEDLQRIASILEVDMDYLVPKVDTELPKGEQIRLRASRSLPPDSQKSILDFIEYAKKLKRKEKR